MGKGLGFNGRKEVALMVASHASGRDIREKIEEVVVSSGNFDYEANEALCRELEAKGYEQTANNLRKQINS